MNTNALEIKELDSQKEQDASKNKDDEVKALAQKNTFNFSTALTTFALTTGAVYASLMAYNKIKQS